MNKVTLVLVIVRTEEMEIYCSTKYLHMTVIMILLEKIYILWESVAVDFYQRSPAVNIALPGGVFQTLFLSYPHEKSSIT